MEPSREPDHSTRYDGGSDRTVAEAIVTAVAAVADEDPNSLEPLYRTVDTDALEKLLDPPTARDEHLQVAVDYAGYRVVATGDGRVDVYEDGDETTGSQ